MVARAFLLTLTIFCCLGVVSAQEQTTEVNNPSETTTGAQDSGGEASAVEDTSEDTLENTLQLNTSQQDSTTVVAPEDFNPLNIVYRIAGENESFKADVEEAFETWQAASVGAVEARQEENASVIFKAVDVALMGPDTLSLKVQNYPETSILLTESLGETGANLYKSALLHEVGSLAGLPLKESGVMSRELSADIVPSVSVEEARALEAQVNTAKEDLNRNGRVDFYDLVELAKNYTEVPQNYSADLTGDGSVNDDDVKQLQDLYEFSDPVDVNATVADETQASSEATNSGTSDQSVTQSPEHAISDAAKAIAEQAAQIGEVVQEKELDSADENPTQDSNVTESSSEEENSSEGQ